MERPFLKISHCISNLYRYLPYFILNYSMLCHLKYDITFIKKFLRENVIILKKVPYNMSLPPPPRFPRILNPTFVIYDFAFSAGEPYLRFLAIR